MPKSTYHYYFKNFIRESKRRYFKWVYADNDIITPTLYHFTMSVKLPEEKINHFIVKNIKITFSSNSRNYCKYDFIYIFNSSQWVYLR